jgi:RIO-like serine/threonine protein kinase
MNNPQFPQLTDNQTLLMEALAYHANFRKVANLDSVCKLVSLSTLEVETGLNQLQAKHLVRRKVTRGTFGSTVFELTLAGKDYALERLELT